MCTVSFIPSARSIIITSNRDEKLVRIPALAPAAYLHKTGFITYPKDAQAGGTWFALHENGNAAVLLNGAFEKHTSQPPYELSRGLVLLDILDSEKPLNGFLQMPMDATTVEPFTLVLWQEQLLYECRWDGATKYYVQKDNRQPHIWSSVTLYDAAIRQQRENWFRQWLQQCPQPQQEQAISFHSFGGNGNIENDLVMSRGNTLSTVSITSAELGQQKTTMQYNDLLSGNTHCKYALINNPAIKEYA
jgi:Transport and Golgi organisation 2